MFREHGVELAASACIKAMQEAKVSSKDITHVVAVTCTDQSNPGYDLLVCQKLGLDRSVQRTLLHGVGCAGGLSALRSAGDIAAAESRRERRACVLVIACELCSLFFKAELQAASRDDALHIAPALFSDAAAALVVINELAVREDRMPVYELREWRSMVVPDTVEHMSYAITADGRLFFNFLWSVS
jgi:type III polyketide synthase